MKNIVFTASSLTVAASMALAGGIERRGDPSQILFEEGKNYFEFSAATVNPTVSGVPLPGIPADSSVTSFSNNDAISAGMKVAFKF